MRVLECPSTTSEDRSTGRTGEDRFAFTVGRKARVRESESRCGYPWRERSQSARAAAATIALRDVDCRCDHYATGRNQDCQQRSSFIGFQSASIKRVVSRIHCGTLIISDPGSALFRRAGRWSPCARSVLAPLCPFRHVGMVFLGPDGLTAFEKGRQLASSHAPVSSLDDEGAWPSGAGEVVPTLREFSRTYDRGWE